MSQKAIQPTNHDPVWLLSHPVGPPGAIRVEHVQGATPARGKEKVGMVSRASFDKREEYVVALEYPGMSLVNR